MRPECITEVEQAIGRPLRKAEAQAIEDKISFHIRDQARTDPVGFNAMTEQQRQLAGAQAAMADHMASVEKAAQRKAFNVIAQARELQNLKDRAAALGGKEPFYEALFERLSQIDTRIKGERNRAFASIIDTIRAAEPRFLGLFTNRAAERDFVLEVYGRDTGNQVAARGAKVWREQMDAIRNRLNAAGANIGRLDYGWLPQPHDSARIRRATADDWGSFVMNRLDRRRYLNEDGTQMGDAQVMEFLAAARETLVTDGLNKMTPGVGRGATRAGKFDEAHRQIHFKDGDAYLEYLNTYGPKSVFEAMQGSVFGQIKDTVLIEQFGPNAAQTYRLLEDTAKKEDHGKRGMLAGTRLGATPDMVWGILNGTTNTPKNARLADINQGIRNFMVAAKLQATLVTAIPGDMLTLLQTSAFHRLPLGETLVDILKSGSSNFREEAAIRAMGMESIISDMTRWHTDNMAQGWTGKMANATMRASMLEGWSNAIRRAFSVGFMNQMVSRTRAGFDALEPRERALMERYGINASDWAVLQAAEPELWRGKQMLTPEAVARVEGFSAREKNDAIGKLLGMIQEESEFTAINPGLLTRASISQGVQRGTVGGELLRHMTLFKSFGLAIFERHWKRIQQIDSRGGKLAYSAALFTGLTMAGAMVLQLQDIMNGRDPRDIRDPRFWLASVLKGGGFGIFGDVFYTGLGGDNRGGQPNWSGLLGPVVGTMGDAGMIAGGELADLYGGQDKHDAGANLMRLGYQNTPFVRLWYTKAALEHAIIHDMQESLSPGYLSRMRQRARKEFGQSYWWEPGEAAPDRGPNLGAMVGGS